MNETGSYSGHHLYRVLTALCVILAALFGWQLYQRWDWGALLFLAVAAWSAFRCLILMSSYVEVTDDQVRVLSPGSAPRVVDFRQCSAVYEEGRGLKSILLLYHPRNDAGIIATDEEATLALPAVNQHEQLLATLMARVNA